jgi:hypothetical protein
VSLVQAELERHGVVTASVTIMPEITRAVGAPRALVVPFGLGRPFGAPGDSAQQSAVLRALLELCARTDVPIMESLTAHPHAGR